MAGVEQEIRLASIERYIAAAHGSSRELSVDEIDVLDSYAGEVVREIAERWPVDTSTSRDEWTYYIDGDTIGFTITNDVDYVEWVHYAGEPAEPPLWETLIPEVWAEVGPRAVAAMQAAVDETERQIVEARRVGVSERAVITGRYRPAARVA